MAILIPATNIASQINNAKTVAIIGYPGAGKTTLAKLFNQNRNVIHTDDYLKYDHDERPSKILEELDKDSYIIEGNEVTRLIKRGLHPELVVLVTGSERLEKSLHGLQGRVKKFLNDYDGFIYVVNPRDK